MSLLDLAQKTFETLSIGVKPDEPPYLYEETKKGTSTSAGTTPTTYELTNKGSNRECRQCDGPIAATRPASDYCSADCALAAPVEPWRARGPAVEQPSVQPLVSEPSCVRCWQPSPNWRTPCAACAPSGSAA